MNTIVLPNNKRLILAGLLAFVILILSQVSVLAYDFIGGLNRSAPTIGFSNKILVIGNTSLPDSSLNIGRMPSVSTGSPTNVGMNGGTHATLNGSIDNMGVASDAYASYQYSTDLSYSQTTPEVVVNAAGAFTQNINGFLPNQIYNVRLVTRVGSVYTLGANQTFYTAATGTFNLIDVTIILVVALLLIVIITLVLVSDMFIVVKMILIGVAVYAVLALLPGLQTLLSALQ